MRIALLAHLHHPIAEPYAGGMEMHTSLVADELVRRGHDVTLFARAGSTTLAQLEPVLGDEFVYGPLRHSHSRDLVLDQAMRRALRRIGQGSFDVVFNNSLNPLPYTELDDYPMLTVLHTPPTLEKVNAVVGRPDWRPGARHSFVAVSKTNARAWRARLPEVSSITNGIRLSQWQPRGTPEKDLAVWSARITPEKGLHLAIDAAREAGMRLEFCGGIGDPAYFEQQIVPRLGPDVVNRGHLNHEELAAMVAGAAVFLATPLWAEPFGLSAVEAMACGTPVAALPHGACPEVVLPMGGCISSPTGLASAIRKARGMDRKQVHRHAQRYDATRMLNRYEDLLHRLVEKPIRLPEPLTA